MPKDLEYMDGGLFPRKVTEIGENTERKIRDSYLDQKVESLKNMYTQLKSEHSETVK